MLTEPITQRPRGPHAEAHAPDRRCVSASGSRDLFCGATAGPVDQCGGADQPSKAEMGVAGEKMHISMLSAAATMVGLIVVATQGTSHAHVQEECVIHLTGVKLAYATWEELVKHRALERRLDPDFDETMRGINLRSEIMAADSQIDLRQAELILCVMNENGKLAE